MNTSNIVDMRKRPPHRTDVLSNAVFGDQIPELFRKGKYYEKRNITYTYDGKGDISVWECQKSGVYGRPAEPSWIPWSMEEVRTRLSNLEAFIGNQSNVYEVSNYDRSYLIHDVGVRDWEKRGSFVEAFNDKKYLAKKHYQIKEEEIVPVGHGKLPNEENTTLYLNKSNNSVTNLIRRVEMYSELGDDGRIKIPFPVDMSLISSYIFDLYIDGIYISQNFINIENGDSGQDKYIVVSFDNINTTQDVDMSNQTVEYIGENLFKNTLDKSYSDTTVHDDGSISLTVKPRTTRALNVQKSFVPPQTGKYRLSGFPSGVPGNNRLYIYDKTLSTIVGEDVGEGVDVVLDDTHIYDISISISPGNASIDALRIYPTICSVTIVDNNDEEKIIISTPVDNITKDSECVFIFYISISHDLSLIKTDYDKFIGNTRDNKWIDITDLNFEEKYQELSVYNNGIRMSDKEYSISMNRISVDNPEYRFTVGSVATASMKTFKIAEDDAVPNVKQETVPIFEENTQLLAIPFIDYDSKGDHFLVFNDGGILLGNQKWFEDDGYINVYDDDAGLTPNDMVEFRMISRDKNMEIRVYPIVATMDNQTTYELPFRLKDCYFHMMFTENGQYISRTKYALSGTLLQFRGKYADMLKGERFELICFNYIGEYGFTSMTNYKSNWNPDYAETIENTLPVDNPEASPPSSGNGSTDENDKDDIIPELDYVPVVNPEGTTLQYVEPNPAPGTKCKLVQNTAVETLKSKITTSGIRMVLGVDCDNQIVCSTYSTNDIIRFASYYDETEEECTNITHEEDTRYTLKELPINNGTITVSETDDFGNTYVYASCTDGSSVIMSVNKDGDVNWTFETINSEEYIANIRSIKYIDGRLYVEYSSDAKIAYRIGYIDVSEVPASKSEQIPFHPIDLEPIPDDDKLVDEIEPYHWCAEISNVNNNHIYVGSDGHRIYEFDGNGNYIKKYTDLVEEFESGHMIDIHCDGLDGNVYGIVEQEEGTDGQTACQLIKYDQYGLPIFSKQYYGRIYMAFDADNYPYIFDFATNTVSKLDKEPEEITNVNGSSEMQPKIIWSYQMGSVTRLDNFFVDPINYHVYVYYYNTNDEYEYRFLELKQNDLPIPKYRHEVVFNGNENVTGTDLIGSSVRDINLLSSPTNRLYIGTVDGSIYTYTQSMREMSKGRTVKLYREESIYEPIYIVSDSDYNFYVIKDNLIEKWNRYERKSKWNRDYSSIISRVTRRIVLNPVTKDLVFIFEDLSGQPSFGKISTIDGELTQMDNISLPNGASIAESDCALACDKKSGDYLIGYTGATIYRYDKDFNWRSEFMYGENTIELKDGPVGNIVVDNNTLGQHIYVTVKNRDNTETYDKIIRYNPGGLPVWEHNFHYSCTHGNIAIDADNNVYVCDEREIRKIDIYGNYVWRFKFREESVSGEEPYYMFMDDFYRVFFMDDQYNLHRIDQYNLTLDPIPDEDPEPPEPQEPEQEPGVDVPEEKNYIDVQRRFDLPFNFDKSTSAMLLFTNTGQYIGNRFYDVYDNQIILKGTPIYENGWIDIVLIENVKESITV